MRGIGSEPVEVWLRDGRPERFVWRGRMYFVLFVRDRQSFPVARPSGETVASEIAVPETAGGEMAAAADVPAGRDVWIVEATAQRNVPATTYELGQDLTSGRWTLSRG